MRKTLKTCLVTVATAASVIGTPSEPRADCVWPIVPPPGSRFFSYDAIAIVRWNEGDLEILHYPDWGIDGVNLVGFAPLPVGLHSLWIWTDSGREICEFEVGDWFVRGDANTDGSVDVSDAVHILASLFTEVEPLRCLDSADANDSGEVDVSDAVSLLGFLFLGSPPPEPPFGECGYDPTPENLRCEWYPPCDGEVCIGQPTWWTSFMGDGSVCRMCCF